MEADNKKLTRRIYNLAGISFTAGELATEIKKQIPDFVCTFVPDKRQAVANSLPRSFCEESNKDWGWNFKQTLPELVAKMLKDVKEQSKPSA